MHIPLQPCFASPAKLRGHGHTVTHSTSSRRAFTIVLLAIAVFCWGTGYKLSLYSQSSQPQVSVAKLLSEAERPASSSAQAIQIPRGGSPALTVFVPLAMLWLTLFQPGCRAFRAAIERPLRLLVQPRCGSTLRAPPVFSR